MQGYNDDFVELDAYEKLRSRKRPGESFSAVVRRATFSDTAPTGADLLAFYKNGGSGVDEDYLRGVEIAEAADQPPDDPWV
ncbi:MAG: hypothetical protein Fur0032_22040 [Terrimicrobiaceae bacterium]